ncbi:MAG: benzoate/H(+) symporter BenE family transporter [Peptococcales bacterium]|jgi:benzoate membrane transport protein
MGMLGKLIERRGGSYPLHDWNYNNIAAGITSALLGITGMPGLALAAAANGNFTTSQIIMWIFSVFVCAGIFGILMALYYRIPIVAASTITGVAFLVTVTGQFTFSELIGSYLLASLLMVLVGYLGFFSKFIKYVPKPIIAAMLAGMIIKYMVNFVISVNQYPLIGGVSLALFFIFSKWSKRIPPVIVAIFTAFLLFFLTQPLNHSALTESFVFTLDFHLPEFTLLGFLSVSIPVFILVLSNDIAVGIGALEQNEFRPPINRIIMLSGFFSSITSLFGGSTVNIGGMMTTICADKEAGQKEKKYIGSVVSGIMFILFGVFSWKLIPLIQALPQSFIAIVIGFALLGVFANSMHNSFSRSDMRISATITFIIAASNISIYNISAPVWALLAGTLISRYIEGSLELSR